MKLGPVTKLDKKNKKPPKRFDNDVTSANCKRHCHFFNS